MANKCDTRMKLFIALNWRMRASLHRTLVNFLRARNITRFVELSDFRNRDIVRTTRKRDVVLRDSLINASISSYTQSAVRRDKTFNEISLEVERNKTSP